jgi:hypothetical protein
VNRSIGGRAVPLDFHAESDKEPDADRTGVRSRQHQSARAPVVGGSARDTP